ncbi:MAG: HAMP domain-containing sensor histidine kinase, partial [Anaerolineales bacterium]
NRTLQTIRQREYRIAELYQREQEHSQELERAYADLHRAEGSRDDLVHMLMHDLRGPLTTILLNIELMTHVYGVPAQADALPRLLIRTETNVRRILGMIDDMLKMSRLEGGSLQPNLAPFDLAACLTDKAIDYRVQADREGKQFALNLRPGLPIIQADADLLNRVIDNLLANAFKFTETGGQIFVTAACQAGSLVVAVKDAGPGIAPADQERIFDKYFQVAHSDHPSARSGIGIGLTFCRLAIEAHGGSIWVESTAEQGSTFSFRLPADCPA